MKSRKVSQNNSPKLEAIISTIQGLAKWKRFLARRARTASARARLAGEAKGLDEAAGFLEILNS